MCYKVQILFRGSNFYVALYWAQELAAKDASWEPLAKVCLFCTFFWVLALRVSDMPALLFKLDL